MQLCKAKGVIGKEWIEGYFCYGFYSDTPCIQDVNTHELTRIDMDTLCYDTGKVDKNGNRIWTNDMVTGIFSFDMPVEGKCIFKDGAYGLEWKNIYGNTQFAAFTSMCNIEYEVVGNAFDNPELSKEQAKEEIEPDR